MYVHGVINSRDAEHLIDFGDGWGLLVLEDEEAAALRYTKDLRGNFVLSFVEVV